MSYSEAIRKSFIDKKDPIIDSQGIDKVNKDFEALKKLVTKSVNKISSNSDLKKAYGLRENRSRFSLDETAKMAKSDSFSDVNSAITSLIVFTRSVEYALRNPDIPIGSIKNPDKAHTNVLKINKEARQMEKKLKQIESS